MEGLLIFGIVGLVFFGPIILSAIAMGQVRSLRNRVDNLEWLAERRAIHEQIQPPVRAVAPAPAPAAPTPAPEQAPRRVFVRPDLQPAPFPGPAPRILRAPEPLTPAPAPKEEVPLENLIGERILPRLGVIAIVLGLGLLAWYSYRHLGAEGKLALTGVTGAAMVVGGVLLRRHPHTQLLGGCLIGGGWAALYLTAYAAHHIDASKVTDNALLGFALLIGVSQAALIHALRYRNETITGMAFLLTIGSLFLAPEPGLACWTGMGLSAVTLMALALKERWIRLCVLGAKLIYAVEIFWLAKTTPVDVLPALGVLVALWAVFIVADHFHKPATDWEKRFHGLLVAINFVGLLATLRLVQEWFNPAYMGWAWISVGALYELHAAIGTRFAWRPAQLASLAFAAVLLGIGFDLELAGLGPVFAWMALSVGLIAWGFGQKNEIPRLMGIAGLVVSLVRFWAVDHRLPSAYAAALAVGGLLYAVSALITWRSRSGRAGSIEAKLATVISHAGAVAFGLATWKYAPDHSAGAIFATGGLGLALLAPRLGARWLIAEGGVFLALAGIFFAGNLGATGHFLGMSTRVASCVPILLAWFCARLAMPADADSTKVRGFFSVLLLAGLMALLNKELGDGATPAAWAVVLGGWFVWCRLARLDFEFLLGALGVAATLLVYATADFLAVPGMNLPGPVPTGIGLIAILLTVHLTGRREGATQLYSFARDLIGVGLATAGFILLEREMTGTWLTGSWAVWGFALAAYGFLANDRVSRWSSLLLLGFCAGKVAIFDLATFEMPVKIATLITLGTIMVALSFVYARHHRRIVTYLVGKNG